MTSRAIGAAVWPPVPDWFWSTTAIATAVSYRRQVLRKR